MVTNNKFIVERTNVLQANKALAATYDYLDEGDFGWYAKAGEVYVFDAFIVYSATAGTEGAAFSINSSASLSGNLFSQWVVEFGTTDATTFVRTQVGAFNTPDHGTASPVAFPTGLNSARVYGVVSVSTDGFIGVTGIAENANQITAVGGYTTLNWKRVNWPAEA
jgi:hypothetical protein